MRPTRISRSYSRFFGIAGFVAIMALAGPSFAGVESDLAAAENAYAALDYATATSSAEAVLAQRGLSHDVLTRACRVAALSHAAQGHGDQAKQAFVLLLQYDPDFKLDTKLGPRFSDPFAEARGYWQAQGRKPGMDVETFVTYGQIGQIRVATRDPLGTVKRITVGYRWAPSRDYAMTTVEPGTKQIEVEANPSSATRLEYYVRAVDAKDSAVFEDGTPDAPKSTTVTEPTRATKEEKKSIFASPWFYIAGGAILAAAGTYGYFALRPTEYTPASSGRTTLGAACGGVRCD